LYDDTLGYARIKSKDQTTVAEEILNGLQGYLESEEGLSLTDQQRQAVQQEISTIRSAGTATRQVQSLFMQPGTTSYDRYAKHDQIVQAITDINSLAEMTKRQNIAESRRLEIKTDPTIKTRYRTQSKNIVDDIYPHLRNINQTAVDLREAVGQADSLVFNIRSERALALRSIYERISAVKSAEISAGRTFGGSDVLDLIDSVQAQMSSLVGSQEARKILMTETIVEDGDQNITAMMELFSQARARRIALASRSRVDLHAVSRVKESYDRSVSVKAIANASLLDAGMPELPADISQITDDQATAFIKAGRKIRKLGGITDAEKVDLEVLSELMGRIRNPDALATYGDSSTDALEAYRYYRQGVAAAASAEEEAGRLAANALLAPVDIPVEASHAATRASSSAAGPTARETTYKRFSDSLKRGALGDALKNKTVKRGLIGAAALSGFSFIYSARKDHSASDVTGPPLMPGGNPYEDGYPQPSVSIQENLNIMNPSTRGMQYKIYTSGSTEDTENLSSMLNGVVDGPINSTMYNSLPRLGQDPYSRVASSF
jgi:hypothetical protein